MSFTGWMIAAFMFLSLNTAHGSTTCSERQLQLKRCRLQSKNVRVELARGEILINDGVWRTVEASPFPIEDSDWFSARLVRVENRTFLELKTWVKTVTVPDVIQELQWAVLEVKDRSLPLRVREVLSRRTLGSVKNPVQDPIEITQLSAEGKTQVHWRAGQRSGRF